MARTCARMKERSSLWPQRGCSVLYNICWVGGFRPIQTDVTATALGGFAMKNGSQNSFTLARFAALATAVVAFAGLALQLVLIIQTFADQGQGWLLAIWRYYGFFTILTDTAVAFTAAALAFRAPAFLLNPVVRLAVATSVIAVGFTYSVALRWTWDPDGWPAVAEHILHDATPLLFALTWFLSGHGGLAWRHTWWAIVPGFAYFIYGMARGAVDGWYAYWFLDPTTQTPSQMAISIMVLMAVFGGLALVLVAIDKWLAARRLA